MGPKIQKLWNLEVLVPHIIKPKLHWTKMKQNNSPELLNILSKVFYPTSAPNRLNYVCPRFTNKCLQDPHTNFKIKSTAEFLARIVDWFPDNLSWFVYPGRYDLYVC